MYCTDSVLYYYCTELLLLLLGHFVDFFHTTQDQATLTMSGSDVAHQGAGVGDSHQGQEQQGENGLDHGHFTICNLQFPISNSRDVQIEKQCAVLRT